eukprot:4914117-Lingulodinium_polyedra.AAC.1
MQPRALSRPLVSALEGQAFCCVIRGQLMLTPMHYSARCGVWICAAALRTVRAFPGRSPAVTSGG